MKGMVLAVAVFFLALSAGEVYAQGKGGGRGRGKAPKGPHERGGLPGRGGGGPDSIRWVASMEQAMSPRDERETKPECILIYVHAPGEAREDATAFNGSLEVARLSRSSAVFHRVAYDPENEWIRRWGVSRSPAFVGADLYGNAFQVIYRISPSQICSLGEKIPPLAERFEQELRKKAEGLDGDEKRAERAARDILNSGRWGYREIDDAIHLYRRKWETEKAAIELMEAEGTKEAEAYVKKLSRTSQGTPLELMAGIRLARYAEATSPAEGLAAIDRIIDGANVLLFEKEIEAARKEREDMLDRGSAKVKKALEEKNREELIRLRDAYKDTRVEEEARAALKKL